MKKLFNLNNPFWAFIGKLLDVIALHAFWLVCCIPIVTIGPATIALYYTLMKEARDEGDHYFGMYFRAFKENFKQGLPAGLIFTIVSLLLLWAAWLDWQQYMVTGKYYWDVLMFITIGIFVFWFATFQYVFPLMARFNNTVKKHMENGFFFMLKNLGWTIVMLAIFIGFYFLIIRFARYIFILTILGYGLVAFLDSYILNYIFKPYVDEAEERAKEEAEKQRPEEENEKAEPALPEEDTEYLTEKKEEENE